MADIDDQVVEDSFGKLSKFNSAGLVNSTTNNLWIDFYRHYRDGRYLSANADLDCIWTIFGGEKVIAKTDTGKYEEIEKKIASAGALRDNLSARGFEPISLVQLKTFASHKKSLIEKALFLRKLQNKQGKGTSYSDPDDEGFD